MDPLSISASIITVVAAAIQSGIAIQRFTSSKDGKRLSRLVSAFEDLNSVVQQIANIIITAPNDNLGQLQELQKLMNKCLEEVKSFKETLAKLEVVATDGRREKAVKRYKMLIEKEEFQEMWEIVRHYAASFNLQLTLLQRHANAEHARSLADLHRSLTQKLALDNETREEARSSSAVILSAMNDVASKVDQLPSFATGQFEILKTVIGQFESQIVAQEAPSNKEVQPTKNMREPENPINTSRRIQCKTNESSPADITKKNELQESIIRLSSVDNEEHTTTWCLRKSRPIIRDLVKVLDALLVQTRPFNKQPNCWEPLPRPMKKATLDDSDSCAESLMKLKNICNSSFGVQFNKPIPASLISRSNSLYRNTQRHFVYVLQDYHIMLLTSSKRLGGPPPKAAEEYNDIVEFGALLEIVSTLTSPRARFSAFFKQNVDHDGYNTLHPVISVQIFEQSSKNTIPPSIFTPLVIPSEAEIFECIRHGDLIKLRLHLEDGRAHLRNCNLNGRSLLDYALYYGQSRIFEFLMLIGAEGISSERPGKQYKSWQFKELHKWYTIKF